MNPYLDDLPTHRSLPKKRLPLACLKPPSERDLEIYKRVCIMGWKRYQVSNSMNIHTTRVSQIVKKVRQWLAAGGQPTDPELRDHAARERLSVATQKLRLLRAIEVASYAVESQPPLAKTSRRRYQGGTLMWTEETTRDEPGPNLKALRLMLRASEALAELERREEADADEAAAPEHDLLWVVFDFLCNCRSRAQEEGQVERSGDVRTLVSKTLANLLGTSAIEGLPIAPYAEPAPVSAALTVSAAGTKACAANVAVETTCRLSVSDRREENFESERCGEEDAEPQPGENAP